MKRKLLIVLLTVVSTVCLALGISACDMFGGGDDDTVSYELSEDGNSYIVTDWLDREIEELIIPDTHDGKPVTEISRSAFSQMPNLKSVTIGNNVTTIGDFAFDSCLLLESVTLGSKVQTIGEDVFRGCELLESIVIPDSVTTIENSAFNECTSLASVTFGSGLTTIGQSAFMDCAITTINIPDSVTEIGNRAFANCMSLKTATINSGAIGERAFSQCTSLETLTLGKNVTSIGDSAFEICTSLAQINYNAVSVADLTETSNVFDVGAGYNALGNYSFVKTTVTIGTDVKRIPAYLFYNEIEAWQLSSHSEDEFSSLEKVIFDENCKCESIGDYAFANCTNFTTITNMPATAVYNISIIDGCANFDTDSLAVIADGGKYLANELIGLVDDTVTYFIVKDGTTSIAENAFADCSNIRFVYIPESVTTIGSGALKFASVSANCTTVIFFEAASGRSSISTNYTNWLGTYAEGSYVYYTCVSSCVADGDYIYKVESEKAVIYAYCGTDTAVTVASALGGYEVSGVNGYAFAELGITSVTLPSTCVTIGGDLSNAAAYVPFGWCKNLTTVTFAAANVEIEAYSFYNCESLTSVDFGSAQVATIMNNAFDGCVSLQSVTLPEMLMIGQAIFNGCIALTSVAAGSGESVTITGYVTASGEFNYTASISVNNGADLAAALKETYATDYIMLYINVDLSAYADMNL